MLNRPTERTDAPPLALRWAWWLAVALGASVVWWAPHPPMVDLPQHAGQLAALKALVQGQWPWAAEFTVNALTPYWLAFGLALPLSFAVGVTAALKLLLTAGFLGFVAAAVALRRALGGDARVDGLFLVGYFGFAWHWGFVTFLAALPLGLGILLLALRQAKAPTRVRAWALSLGTCGLLFAHGLVFLFTWGGVALLLGWPTGPLRQRLLRLWPLLLPSLAVLAYAVASRQGEAAFAVTPTVPAVMGHWGLRHEVLSWVHVAHPTAWAHALTLALMAVPPLAGLRLQPWRHPAWALALLCGGVLALVPSFVFETSFVYERFSVLLLPAWAWLWRPAADEPARWRGIGVAAVASVLVGGALAQQAERVAAFGREEADFRALADQLPPQQRVLALISDRASAAARQRNAYIHHGSWLQAERGELVDFNFAWVQPQVLRYRPEVRPPVDLAFPRDPSVFQWQQHQGARYDGFLVHGEAAQATLRAQMPATCDPAQLRVGSWLWVSVAPQAACRAAP